MKNTRITNHDENHYSHEIEIQNKICIIFLIKELFFIRFILENLFSVMLVSLQYFI